MDPTRDKKSIILVRTCSETYPYIKVEPKVMGPHLIDPHPIHIQIKIPFNDVEKDYIR